MVSVSDATTIGFELPFAERVTPAFDDVQIALYPVIGLPPLLPGCVNATETDKLCGAATPIVGAPGTLIVVVVVVVEEVVVVRPNGSGRTIVAKVWSVRFEATRIWQLFHAGSPVTPSRVPLLGDDHCPCE